MDETTKRLEAVCQQSYPLSLTEEDAVAMVTCIRNIMDEVPDDSRVIVRGDYDLVTAALHHPSLTA